MVADFDDVDSYLGYRDNAEHKEKVTKSYSVSDKAIRVSVISEGGKLVPGMENRVFLAAIYPDGSPAPNTEIKIWHKKLADANDFYRRAEGMGAFIPSQVRKARIGRNPYPDQSPSDFGVLF